MANIGFNDANVIPLFQSRYEKSFAGSWASRLSLFNGNSSLASEEYGIFGGYPKMREWIGARQGQTTAKKSVTISNKPYESSLVIYDRDLSRDKSGMLSAYIGQFANGVVANQWEDLLTDLIIANGTCYDGQSFFDTDHSWEDSGTQKNSIGATEAPSSNVTTTTAPTATEAANVILETTGHMLTFKDNKGRYVNGDARRFIIMVSTVPMFSACVQAVTANLLTGTVDNPLTGLKQTGFQYDVLLNPGITSATTKIYLFREDGELKPFLLQEEQGIQYELLGQGSDFHFENHGIKLGVNSSRGAGLGLWEHACVVTLT